MKRTVLVVEPDSSARLLLERVLTAAGYATEEFVSAFDARVLLDEGAFDIAIVDELAGSGDPLDEVRELRAGYPALPIVVTGTMLSASVILDLLRLGVADALLKPFTPNELRDSMARVATTTLPGRTEALEFGAAIASARHALSTGDTARAAPALVRAYAKVPLDAEVALLEALRAELEGRDEDASRGYRSAIALRDDESGEPPDAFESLARLSAYRGASPVIALPRAFENAPIRIIADPIAELAAPIPAIGEGPLVTVFTLSIAAGEEGTLYFRLSGSNAFAIATSDLRASRLAPLLARVGDGPILASEKSPELGLDVLALTALRDELRRRAASVAPVARTGAQ